MAWATSHLLLLPWGRERGRNEPLSGISIELNAKRAGEFFEMVQIADQHRLDLLAIRASPLGSIQPFDPSKVVCYDRMSWIMTW